MLNFCNRFVGFIAENPNFSAFTLGFSVFSVSLGLYSVPLAGVIDGLLLMGVAAYPYVRKG